MEPPDLVLVRYGEVTLKDAWTRASWERILQANIAQALRDAGVEHTISRDRGRIFVHTPDPRAPSLIADVFGVVSTSPAYSVRPDLPAVSRVAVELAQSFNPSSFAIRPRRSGGSISSDSLGREVGQAVKDATSARVDLSRPEMEIFIEARPDKVLVFKDVVKGVGGLPLGSQSRMLVLISGGIDSPVAAWMMMKRGCPVSLLHFDARPYAESRAAAMEAAQVLRKWTSGRKINFITVENAPGIDRIASHHPRATCVLCRRLMYLVAAEIMKREEAYGIVTGYSLGQVASQTPENIMAEQVGTMAPVYHPLISMDKSEIMDLARKIGTYGVTQETKSCTAVPQKPMTRANLEEIRAMEEELGLKELALELARGAWVERI
ncbi:MAG: tRNA 4-thiouridine(8) synthase ThiI [Methanosarcinales archaeon]|nr:tRNA 4-thiouridine(8) synthase ThiI [Methanosarcinales archaeon]